MAKRASSDVWTMSKGKRSRKDIAIITVSIIAAMLIAFFVASIVMATVHTNKYLKFVDEFTVSINEGRRQGGVQVTHGDREYVLDNNNASGIYKAILDVGMGKTQNAPPEGADLYILNFPDGAEMHICQTDIPETNRNSDEGIYIRYINADGATYQYDTDLIVPRYMLSLLQE